MVCKNTIAEKLKYTGALGMRTVAHLQGLAISAKDESDDYGASGVWNVRNPGACYFGLGASEYCNDIGLL